MVSQSPQRERPASPHAKHGNETAGSLTDALPWGTDNGKHRKR